MRCLIVNFDCHSVSTVLQHKISVAAVLVNIVEVILRIEVSGLLCTKGFTEQLYKQVLRDAAGSRMIDRHLTHLIFYKTHHVR